jgi:hypothetical protein
MPKQPANNEPKDAGEDKLPAGSPKDAPVEHPQRLNRPRGTYTDRMVRGQDIKKG